jgi:hypothetical protein
MNSDQSKNKIFVKFGKGSLLIFAGIVVGVISVLVIAIRFQPQSGDVEEIKLQYTVEYINSEQLRLGIDCHSLRQTLQNFLISDVHPAVSALKLGHDVSQFTRNKMRDIDEFYFACKKLHHISQHVQWDGLKDLNFTENLDNEMITLNTYIRHGGFVESCTASCLDSKLSMLQVSVLKIERAINESTGSDSIEK